MLNFLDNYSMYGIMNQDAAIQVILIDTDLTYQKLTSTIVNEYKEWILIDEEDFILI